MSLNTVWIIYKISLDDSRYFSMRYNRFFLLGYLVVSSRPQTHTSPWLHYAYSAQKFFQKRPPQNNIFKRLLLRKLSGGMPAFAVTNILCFKRRYCRMPVEYIGICVVYTCEGTYFMMTAVERLKGTPHSKPGDKNSRIALQEVSTKYIALCRTARVEKDGKSYYTMNRTAPPKHACWTGVKSTLSLCVCIVVIAYAKWNVFMESHKCEFGKFM